MNIRLINFFETKAFEGGHKNTGFQFIVRSGMCNTFELLIYDFKYGFQKIPSRPIYSNGHISPLWVYCLLFCGVHYLLCEFGIILLRCHSVLP